MVRVLAFVGIGLWIIFVPNSPLDEYPVVLLLGAFALHLLFVLFSISHKFIAAWTLHVSTLAFDLIFLTLLTRFTGGVTSPLIALYYLFLPFASYLLGLRVAIFTALMSTLLYLAANFSLPGAMVSGSLLMIKVGDGHEGRSTPFLLLRFFLGLLVKIFVCLSRCAVT